MASASSAVARPAGYAALLEQYGLHAHKQEHSYAISDQHRTRQLPGCTLLTPRPGFGRDGAAVQPLRKPAPAALRQY